MKRLLTLALPLMLAGCPGPQQADAAAGQAAPEAAAAPAIDPDPAAESAPAAPVDAGQASKPDFKPVAVIRLAATLPDMHWALQDAVDAKGKRIGALFVQADKPLELQFQRDGKLAVANACNLLSGSYVLSGHVLKSGPMASTLKACADPALTALDHEAGSRLEGDLDVRMSPGATTWLELTNKAGDVLTFVGSQTADAKYGGPGERIFLEVAPETRPCNHPLMKDRHCLQVREIQYDDKGLRVGTPGAFESFTDVIEGYRYEAGVRNVLRVNRYTLKNPPADASKYAYVLDMVVEADASKKQAAAKDAPGKDGGKK